MGLFASAIGMFLLWHSSYCPASICAAAAAGEEGPSCTAPRPTSDALRPFCFIPRSTISKEAQKVLQERRVLPGGSLREAPREKVLAFQAAYNARTAPVSEAARRAHLQVRDVERAARQRSTTNTLSVHTRSRRALHDCTRLQHTCCVTSACVIACCCLTVTTCPPTGCVQRSDSWCDHLHCNTQGVCQQQQQQWQAVGILAWRGLCQGLL
jgi:hypothetical protein